jgi:hypothetical protein
MEKVTGKNIGKISIKCEQEDNSYTELLPVRVIENKILDRIDRTMKMRDVLEELLTAYNQTFSYEAWLLTSLFIKCKMIAEGTAYE